MKKIVSFLLFVCASQFATAQVYGPFIGGSLNIYKSNLFNSDDLRADSFQKYSITPGFGGSFDFGYLYENGFSVNSGLQFGTNNQKYTGSDVAYQYKLEANTNMSFFKIPLTFGMQKMDEEHKMTLRYNVGFFYSYLTGYKDYMLQDYLLEQLPDYETTITKKLLTNSIVNDTNTTSYVLDRRPYTRHGFGAIASLGVGIRIATKVDFLIQAKGEFQLTNAEYTGEIRYTNTKTNPITPYIPFDARPFGNYAKYMTDPKKNYNRAGTHPFNLGITFGLKYYLFQF